MASNRQNNQNINQGRPLKPTLASNRTSKPPITPRLAANATTSSNTFPRRAAAPPKLADSATRPPSSHDSDTPAKAFLTANVTPRSSSRKSRVDSTNTTPTTSADDTPSHPRPRVLSPAATEPVFRPAHPGEARPPSVAGRPKSTLGGRDTVKGSTVGRTPIYLSAHNAAPNKITKDTSSLFFRANEANPKPHTDPKPQVKPVLKKTPTFLYANGKEEGSKKTSSRSTSPVLSAVSGLHSIPATGSSDLTATPLLLSPPLSSISSRTPYFQNPIANSPTFRPASPPKENIHLSYRKGASQILAHGLQRGTSASPVSILPDRPITSTAQMLQQRNESAPRKPSLNLSGLRESHTKSNSLSSIDSGSPNQNRKRSMTGTHIGEAIKPPTFLPPTDSATRPGTQPPLLQSIKINGDGFRSSPQELIQSPTKAVPDLAAEARRERKVLDLEISNSSLLAINRSLEREMKKQKAELKRFRRLSRAGQFAVSTFQENPTTILDEGGDEGQEHLPDFGADGRPSSPFLEDPLEELDEFSDDDSTNSSAEPLSPNARADKDARVRAEDEARLRLDLSRHRELLMDTQRMNKSLQRCLTWTEDLIKGGRKALEYQVPIKDVNLGGHVLSGYDDFDEQSVRAEDEDDEDDVSQTNDNESQADPIDMPDADVGLRIQHGNDHRVVFGQPSQLRSPLTMSRHNPNHAQAPFRNLGGSF